MIKRVACLYRVSTKSQLTNDDIPMQIKACANFIKKQRTWKLEKEYTEKGVSGYHKSANERDVLVQLRKDAADGVFDILLVFMFDRLGRREDETPFIVEWFVKQGIEVWSVNEGQQTFDDHMDKLLNYIRYWQSSGESENTSMRVAEKHNQLVMAGKFRGGVAPFGYRLEYSGEYNKKGHERKKLVIHEPEAVVARKIFDLSSDIDMGSYRVAKTLNDEGYRTRTGKHWTVQTIVRMLRNPVYKGDYVAGKVRYKRGKKVATPKESWVHSQALVDELMVISPDLWEKANENVSLRDTKAQVKPAPSIKYDFLLTEVAYCGYCGTKLHPRVSSSKRQLKTTGEVVVHKSRYYNCPKRTRLGDCTGQFQYGIVKIETIVRDEIYSYLDSIRAMNISQLAKPQKARLLKEQAQTLKPITQKITVLKKEVAKLEGEILKCLMGESVFTEKQLAAVMKDATSALSVLEQEASVIKAETDTVLGRVDELIGFKESTVSWEKEFAKADADRQKELVSMIVDRVQISRGAVDISFVYSLYDIESICGSAIGWHGGAPPSCPIGSACCGGIGAFEGEIDGMRGGRCGCRAGCRCGRCGRCGTGGGRGRFVGSWNWLGSVTEIPICKIVSFTHNAI